MQDCSTVSLTVEAVDKENRVFVKSVLSSLKSEQV